MPEEAEAGERGPEEPARTEQVLDAEHDDEARKEEGDQEERAHQFPPGPWVPPQEDARRVPERHRERGRHPPLEERVGHRMLVEGLREQAPEPGDPADRGERAREQQADREEREQRDEGRDRDEHHELAEGASHGVPEAIVSQSSTHPVRFAATWEGDVSAFRGTIEVGSMFAS